MKKNIMDILKERGYIKQIVFEEELYKLLDEQSVPFYIGFDPTADSLHIGHFLALMAMSHMQKAGHKPIVLIGGGTAMIGDPSGRTDMRSMMTNETIAHNCECFKTQMSRFFTFDGDNAAVMVNNADWLLDLNYLEFIRDIGSMFSVNRMLSADCFKQRLEKGLSFLEFNYMLMQSYDFLVLYQKYGTLLQCGGDDQWSNILAGADLIRRKEGKSAFAMTFELLTTSEGKKMGKTQKGALWLDPNKTTPYEFYQYFRNIDDADVNKCMRFLTFMDMTEITELTKHMDERMNLAKERLAFEVTKIVHGEEEALKASVQAKGAFGGNEDNMPSIELKLSSRNIIDILLELKLAKSKGEAKRLIDGGGVRINDMLISGYDYEIGESEFNNGFIIHKGKKVHIKVKTI
jgi:tyrosyl-tRNA synthetase